MVRSRSSGPDGVRPSRRRGITAGVGAAAVAQPQPAGLGLGEEPHRPTPVQDLAGGAEDDGDDGSVAGEAADGLWGEVGAGVQPAEGGGRAPTRSLSASRSMVSRRVVCWSCRPRPLLRRPGGPRPPGHRRGAVGGAQVAFTLDRLRAPTADRVRLEDALALHVEGQPVLERAGAGVLRLGQGDEGLPHVLWSCRPVAPVLRQDRRAQQPAPLGPCCSAKAITLEDVRLGAGGQQRPQLVRLRHHTTRPTAPATARSTACSKGWLMALPNACARATTTGPRPAWTGRGGGPTGPESSPPTRGGLSRPNASRVTVTRAASPAITARRPHPRASQAFGPTTARCLPQHCARADRDERAAAIRSRCSARLRPWLGSPP